MVLQAHVSRIEGSVEIPKAESLNYLQGPKGWQRFISSFCRVENYCGGRCAVTIAILQGGKAVGNQSKRVPFD